jgi:CRISPR-associated protein Cas5h
MWAFSIDLIGELALFKKNDANDMVHISYNFIHKIVVLGMFGAIMGLKGYSKSGKGKRPEFYEKLKNVKIAIRPHYQKPLKKVVTGFNNASGHANIGDKQDGSTWQVREQVLVGSPNIGYTVYVIDDETSKELKDKLSRYETKYPLYFGKNEFFAHYENFTEYEVEAISEKPVIVNSLFRKGDGEIPKFTFDDFDPLAFNESSGYLVLEQLPYDFDKYGFYMKDLFAWTQNKIRIKGASGFKKLISKEGEPVNVQFI